METTRLSSKGQIIIPQPIREAHQWEPGEQFAVLELDGGLLLTPIKAHKKTSTEDVLGCLHYDGPEKSLSDMEKAILDEARKNNDRD